MYTYEEIISQHECDQLECDQNSYDSIDLMIWQMLWSIIFD